MSKSQSGNRGAPRATGLLTFTIDPSTAQIVKLEALDAAGARHELTDDEKASLTKRKGEQTLEQVVERAFEAGIACVLDGENGRDDQLESSEDRDLTHRLLAPLIEHSAAKRLIARPLLDRAILDTLIEHSLTPAPDAAGRPAAGAQ